MNSLLSSTALGLVTDFDGTVSPLVSTPQEAQISPICKEALASLAQHLALVAVVSGRAVEDLRSKVGLSSLVYVGNHGMEYWREGKSYFVRDAEPYVQRIHAAVNFLKPRLNTPGLVWEDKGVSASVHYRLALDPEQTRKAILKEIHACTEAQGLIVSEGKLVIEMRSPLGLDKGSAVKSLAREYGLTNIVVIGDDITDVDAFKAVHELKDIPRIQGVTLGVVYTDSPKALYDESDFILRSVSEVEEFLSWLRNRFH